MIALSLALSYVATLAFVAYLRWDSRDAKDNERILATVRAVKVEAEHAIKVTGESAQRLKLLEERAGKVEMALGVKRVSLG